MNTVPRFTLTCAMYQIKSTLWFLITTVSHIEVWDLFALAALFIYLNFACNVWLISFSSTHELLHGGQLCSENVFFISRAGDQLWPHLAENSDCAAPAEGSRWQYNEWNRPGWSHGVLFGLWGDSTLCKTRVCFVTEDQLFCTSC